MIARAFAKLNLALQVEGRRADGFHELRTLFQTIALCDELSFEPASKLELTVVGERREAVPSDDSNLVMRAARALAERAAVRRGARIRLHKRIPSGGGLGGGSSDAATTLVALDRLWDTRLGRAALSELAIELGSDVRFFLLGGTALGEGRGERLAPFVPLSRYYVTLGLPSFGLGTAAVFASHARRAGTAGRFVAGARSAPAWQRPGFSWEELGQLRNELEPAAFELRPELAEVLQVLSGSGARLSGMSGSGSSCFGLYDTLGEATEAVERLGAAGIDGLVTETLDRDRFLDLRQGR